MSVSTVERVKYECQTCHAKTDGAVEEIRARVLGWRIWSGTTIGGAESSVVFCPACCGEGGVDEETGDPVGFDAECFTCNARMTDEDGEGPWTKAEAEEWEDQHECEPETMIIEPKKKVS